MSPVNHTRNRSQNSTTAGANNSDRAIEAMCGQMALSRLPITEPDVFDGKDGLLFPIWKTTFDAIINRGIMSPEDKLSLLNKYVGGEAKVAIQGFLLSPPAEAFSEAYKLLVGRYGENFQIGIAFRDRLRSWPKITGTDVTSLRNFVDFLRQCRTAQRNYQSLSVLNDEIVNADMMKKLPPWLARQWMRRVAGHREATGEFPPFSEFVEFLEQEDKIAHDSLAQTFRNSEGTIERRKGTSFASDSRREPLNSNTTPGSRFGTCLFCREKHSIQICEKFSVIPFANRQRFIRDNQLCYGCLVKGHLSRDCRNRKTCQICQQSHPTSMHRTEFPSEDITPAVPITACASNNHLNNTPRKSSMVLPVYISHTNNPGKEIMAYAMLDSQSDASFITDNTAKALGLCGSETRLSLSTMTANNKIVKCQRFENLVIRGLNGNLKIPLPQVYSRKTIPINHQHIPCTDMIDSWPHLEILRDKIAPKFNCEVGLLIGYDCPTAMKPTNAVSAPANTNGPFGLETELGWGIVGVISSNTTTNTDKDSIGISHGIAAIPLTGSQIVLPKHTKEIVFPAECLKLLGRDFEDHDQNEVSSSLDDKLFLKAMEEGIRVDDIHWADKRQFWV